jgi:hypothetical protein
MKLMLQIISMVGILLTIVPPILFFLGKISHSSQNFWMLIGAIIWFASASFWLGRKVKEENR